MGGGSAEALAQVAALLESATPVRVPRYFRGADLAAIRDAASHDPRIAFALEHAADGKVIQYLAGAPILLDKRVNATPPVRALIDAAIDARRLGHVNRLPKRFLVEAAHGYLDGDDLDRPPGDWPTRALRATSADWRGLDGPLHPIPPQPGAPIPEELDYRLADVLDQVGARDRWYDAPPEQFWAAAARYGYPGSLLGLAFSAQSRGPLPARGDPLPESRQRRGPGPPGRAERGGRRPPSSRTAGCPCSRGRAHRHGKPPYLETRAGRRRSRRGAARSHGLGRRSHRRAARPGSQEIPDR
jgi:hypothetical protein